MFSLYVHWPFCRQKCAYCNFLSYSGKESLINPYVEALKVEIKKTAQANSRPLIDTVYFGGGDPLVVGADNLVAVLQEIKQNFVISENAEVSVEGNPESVSWQKLKKLKDAGFNRLSLGAQSFNDADLKFLGRLHSAEQIVKAVDIGYQSGFNNISLDLIYGLPGQQEKHWQQQLEQAVSLGIKHMSTYALTVEPQTPLAKKNFKTAEAEAAKLYTATLKLLTAAGFNQYELSNFCLPGYECQHNLNYWLGGAYLGLGLGAVSYLNGKRFKRETNLKSYLKKVNSKETTVVNSEELSWRQKVGERTVLLLRLSDFKETQIKQMFNLDFKSYFFNELAFLKKHKLIQANLELTVKGKLLANEVMSCFI